MDLSVEVDMSKLDRLLPEYYKETTKTMEQVLNTKAYYILRNAVQETFSATKGEIRSELMQTVTSKDGTAGPRAALIINSQRKKQGMKGLRGPLMNDAIKKLVSKRQRSISFLRAGWIPGIKTLQPLVDKNYKGSGAVLDPKFSRGAPKGGALPATQSTGGGILKASVELWNSVRGDSRPPRVIKHLAEGLQRAVDREIASIEVYLNKKLGEAAGRTINR